ncbi:MAG TPA: efflux RND transporter periplasmic adaptor subunit [Desulfobacteria bacterium]|nr:efflux RND transporter periplasmic adaptor subunit [Desulfobacteria bacterium]
MKRLAWVLVSLIILGGIGGYYLYQRQSNDIPTVKVIPATRKAIEAKVYATGTINLANKQQVTITAPAVIRSLPVRVGDRVKAGDLLVGFDSEAIDLQIKQAQANFDAALANRTAARARLTSLKQALAKQSAGSSQASGTKQSVGSQSFGPPIPGTGAGGLEGLSGLSNTAGQIGQQVTQGVQGVAAQIDQSMIDAANTAVIQAGAAVKQAQAALAIAQNQKNNTRIAATMDGTVLQVNGTVNQAASPQLPLVVIGDLRNLVIEADINEVDASKLAVGQKVTITGATLGGKTFNGTVNTIAPMAETQVTAQGSQTTVPINIGVGKADPAMKPGYSVSLTIVTATKQNALQVPQETIISQDGDEFVYVVRNGVLVKVKVATGIVGDVNTEITAGLNQGDQVVLNVSQGLRAGTRVKVE